MAYAPTNDSDDFLKDEFYQFLEQTVQSINPTDVIVCLGDFNAVTSTVRDGFKRVMGPFDSGTPNDNSARLLDFCLGADLRVAGSWFERHDIHRFSWYSYDGQTAKEIDHVLVNTHWKVIQNYPVYRSMEFDSDHRPLV